MGGHNSDSHRNWWPTSGVDWSLRRDILAVFANGGLKVLLSILGWPQKVLFLAKDYHVSPSCDTKILIGIKSQWSSSEGSWPHSLRIFILLPVGALSSSLNALRSSSCYGWRVGNVYTHSCVTATAEHIVTWLTLLTLLTSLTLLTLLTLPYLPYLDYC